MAKKDLSTQTMVTTSGPWFEPAPDGTRSELEAHPLTLALLPELLTAHEELLRMHKATEKRELRLSQIVEELVVYDAVHDRKVRALYGLLTALADATDDRDLARRYLALRDRLYVRGLRVVNYSYEDEAGEAKLVRQRARDEDLAFMDATKAGDNTLKVVFDGWMASAAGLGKLVQERGQLNAQVKRESIAPIDVLNARRAWIRAVATLEQILELTEADDERIANLLGPLREAEEKAAKSRSELPDATPTEEATSDDSATTEVPSGEAPTG